MNSFEHFLADLSGQTNDIFFKILIFGIILILLNKILGSKWLIIIGFILEIAALYHYFFS